MFTVGLSNHIVGSSCKAREKREGQTDKRMNNAAAEALFDMLTSPMST